MAHESHAFPSNPGRPGYFTRRERVIDNRY
jgi:hypothetical protein